MLVLIVSFHRLKSLSKSLWLGCVDFIKNSGCFLAYAEYLARTICSAVADRNIFKSLCNLPQHDEYTLTSASTSTTPIPPIPPQGHGSIAAPPNDVLFFGADVVLLLPLFPFRFFFFFFFLLPPAAKRLVLLLLEVYVVAGAKDNADDDITIVFVVGNIDIEDNVVMVVVVVVVGSG